VGNIRFWLGLADHKRLLSSLTTEDAIAYRSFLRHPAPRARWIGPPCSRSSPEWRPFAGALTHATHAPDGGTEITAVRDNLRHSSISTTSMYLHADDARRAKQITGVFGARSS